MKPVCVKCNREMQRQQSGVVALYQFQQPPEPYQAFMSDLFECPECGAQVLSGFGDRPFWQHWEGTKPPSEPFTVIEVKES